MLHLITVALKLIITSPDQTDKMRVITFYESVAVLQILNPLLTRLSLK